MASDNVAQSVLGTVLGEIKSAKIKAGQGVIKGILQEREKILEILRGQEEKIAEVLAGIGATEEQIAEALAALN